MPLKSIFFRDDPVFEACLVKDSAHIVPGARGAHVSKIHQVLMITDRAHIAAGEIEQTVYGPSTSAAVLAFKQQRRIINFSYQTAADSIVGKMTIAAMDAEMLALELRTGHISPPLR